MRRLIVTAALLIGLDRRTVTKYRKELSIPPASKRKKIY